jgi:hypothetical protein
MGCLQLVDYEKSIADMSKYHGDLLFLDTVVKYVLIELIINNMIKLLYDDELVFILFNEELLYNAVVVELCDCFADFFNAFNVVIYKLLIPCVLYVVERAMEELV